MKGEILIGALGISIVGVVSIYVVLSILMILLSGIGRLISNFDSKPQVSSGKSDTSEEQTKKDLAIIAAVMQFKGHHGPLKVKLIK